MIRVTDMNGAAHYLAAENVARITEASASSQWHGIRAIVKTFDGALIECQQDAAAIGSQVDAARLATGPSGSDQP